MWDSLKGLLLAASFHRVVSGVDSGFQVRDGEESGCWGNREVRLRRQAACQVA